MIRRIRPRLAALAAAGAALCTVGGAVPAAAPAHETNPQIRSRIDAVRPALPAGVEIELIESIATELSVVNRTRRTLEVLGRAGRPFLRIGPDGVQADIASPDWYRTNDPTGLAGIPEGVRGGDAAPQWVEVAEEPSWAWFDHRMHPEENANVPTDALRQRRAATLARWTVPMRYGGAEVEVAGVVEFRPLVGRQSQRLTSSPQLAGAGFVTLLPGAVPGLFVESTGSEPLTVIGREGAPFARIGPDGVEVNLRSPTHIDDQRARGESPTVAAEADAAPRWKKVADVPRYSWLESRARYARQQPPQAVLERDEPSVLLRWSVPVRAAGERVAITGETSWVPRPASLAAPGAGDDAGGGGVSPLLWIVPLALLPLLGAAFLARRVRERGGRAAFMTGRAGAYGRRGRSGTDRRR